MDTQDPKEALLEGVKKSQEMNSYNFEGNFKLAIKTDEPTMDPSTAMALQVFEDFNIKYTGAYTKDPGKLSLFLKQALILVI